MAVNIEDVLEFENIPCNLCGNDNVEVIWVETTDDTWWSHKFNKDKEVRIVKCKKCGLAYTNPRPTMESRMRMYSPEYNEDIKKLGRALGFDLIQQIRHFDVYRKGLDIIRKFKPVGELFDKKLLDVGCAGGMFMAMASSLYYDVEGCGIYEPEVKLAQIVTNRKVYYGNIIDLPVPAGSYDIVTLLDVIEHATDPLGLLRVVWRVLKDDGMLFLVTPTFRLNNPLSHFLGSTRRLRKEHFCHPLKRKRDNITLSYQACEHIYHFDLISLQKMLVKAGFRKTKLFHLNCAGHALQKESQLALLERYLSHYLHHFGSAFYSGSQCWCAFK